MNLNKACETESELGILQESFLITDEYKKAVLQQRVAFWTNAMAEDIPSRFIADWNNDEDLLDLDGENREILQLGLNTKRRNPSMNRYSYAEFLLALLIDQKLIVYNRELQYILGLDYTVQFH